MRAGGRETYPIKIIETAGKTLEQTTMSALLENSSIRSDFGDQLLENLRFDFGAIMLSKELTKKDIFIKLILVNTCCLISISPLNVVKSPSIFRA